MVCYLNQLAPLVDLKRNPLDVISSNWLSFGQDNQKHKCLDTASCEQPRTPHAMDAPSTCHGLPGEIRYTSDTHHLTIHDHTTEPRPEMSGRRHGSNLCPGSHENTVSCSHVHNSSQPYVTRCSRQVSAYCQHWDHLVFHWSLPSFAPTEPNQSLARSSTRGVKGRVPFHRRLGGSAWRQSRPLWTGPPGLCWLTSVMDHWWPMGTNGKWMGWKT